jgi:methylenetetrahydrofolate reductase (NADPH)
MKTKVPGMEVPQEIVDRMASVPKEKQPEEGVTICVRDHRAAQKVEGVAGFHIMAIDWEEKVKEIVERAGLLPETSGIIGKRPTFTITPRRISHE